MAVNFYYQNVKTRVILTINLKRLHQTAINLTIKIKLFKIKQAATEQKKNHVHYTITVVNL